MTHDHDSTHDTTHQERKPYARRNASPRLYLVVVGERMKGEAVVVADRQDEVVLISTPAPMIPEKSVLAMLGRRHRNPENESIAQIGAGIAADLEGDGRSRPRMEPPCRRRRKRMRKIRGIWNSRAGARRPSTRSREIRAFLDEAQLGLERKPLRKQKRAEHADDQTDAARRCPR